MAKVYRIADKLKIAGCGTVYMIKMNENEELHVNDILYDLKGHRFQIVAFEMVGRFKSELSVEKMHVGIRFQPLDGAAAEGELLVDSLKDINFLFCNHPLYQRRVDEDYQEEYEAARLHYACGLFSYEDMERGILSLYGEHISGLTIYRGWMMKPEMYRMLYTLLEEKGIILINSPEEYERYHLLPGWYQEFREETIYSVWEDKGTLDSAMDLTKNLHGSYVIKDYVKSRKHEWYDACFISDIENREDTERIIRNFIERQASGLVGGVVLREFVKLKSIGYHEKSGMPLSEEYRIFVFAGNILCIHDYWEKINKSGLSDNEREWIRLMAGRIRSSFVTMDVARKENGDLILMECGDGQVSGLQQMEPSDFIRAFGVR